MARYSKAPSTFLYAVTSQGERSVTLGICPLNSHNDSHRVDGVSLETDGIVVAMTDPENHCIGEYAIPYRNAISVNAGLRQCSSMSYTHGYANAPPWAVLCRAVGTSFRFIVAYSDVALFSYINPRVFKIEKAYNSRNVELK